jgi:hypothetical protein
LPLGKRCPAVCPAGTSGAGVCLAPADDPQDRDWNRLAARIGSKSRGWKGVRGALEREVDSIKRGGPCTGWGEQISSCTGIGMIMSIYHY